MQPLEKETHSPDYMMLLYNLCTLFVVFWYASDKHDKKHTDAHIKNSGCWNTSANK